MKNLIAKIKENKKLQIGLIAAAVLLVVLAGGYTYGVVYFSSHFFANSTVNEIDSSCKDVATVAEELGEAVLDYSLTLTLSDGSTVEISGDELGISSNVTEELIYYNLQEQNAYAWIAAYFKSTAYVCDTAVTFDEEVVEQVISNLDCVTTTAYTPSEDAYLSYEDGAYVIVPEVYGDQVILATLLTTVKSVLGEMETSINLADSYCYVLPSITEENECLITSCDTFNSYISTSFTYVIGDDVIAIDSDTIASWLIIDDEYNYTFDEDAMSEMISSLSKTYNTCGFDKTLESQYGVTVTVPGGNYGWRVDKEGELEQLKEDIISGETIERDLVYTYTAASHGTNDYGNSYVEINKTAQTLFLIIEGEVVLETPIVTGSEPAGNGTPCGAFAITYCTTDAVLRGATYTTPVSYWMPFNGNIGMHDATWQKSFGGTRYLDGYGSHGCINMPYSAAETVYSYVYAGFPVLMYELEGTETVDTLAQKNAKTCVSLISAIGTVTLNSESAIVAAEEAYEELNSGGKSLVTNYDDLVAARSAYDALVAASSTATEE